MVFPKELQEYISRLPPAWQNNARDIVRSDFERILKLDQNKAARILNGKYGFDFDYKGALQSDWGNDPQELIEK